MVWLLPGALANSIVQDFGLSDAQKGLMVAVPLLGGAVLRLALGLLTDRIGARRHGHPGDVADGDPPAARLALGRQLRRDAAGRPAAGRGGGQLCRGAAAGEPLVSASLPGAGDGDRRGRQQRHGPGHVLRPPTRRRRGAGTPFSAWRWSPSCDARLFRCLRQGQPEPAGAAVPGGLRRRAQDSPTPGGSACSTRSRSAASWGWRAS